MIAANLLNEGSLAAACQICKTSKNRCKGRWSKIMSWNVRHSMPSTHATNKTINCWILSACKGHYVIGCWTGFDAQY